jgi:hypothetical protein
MMRKFLACRPGQTGYSPESDLNSVVWIQHKEQPTTTNLCFPTEQGRETDEIFSYSKIQSQVRIYSKENRNFQGLI